MLKENLERVLKIFRDKVVDDAKANLVKEGKSNTGSLYNSIQGNEIKLTQNSLQMTIKMNSYGAFVDQGVQGLKHKNKAPNSPFAFGTGTGEKGGLTKGINEWVASKRLQFRDVKGRYMSYQQTAKVIIRSVYLKGIKPTFFMTEAFDKNIKDLPKQLTEAFALDADNLMKLTIKENFRNNG